jgi:hypothetical protein
MAKYIKEQAESGVRLLTLEISEDELAVWVTALRYLLDHLDDQTLECSVGAYREEVEATHDHLQEWLDPEMAEIVDGSQLAEVA